MQQNQHSTQRVANPPNSRNQEDRILWLLQAAWPNWTPALDLARISLQYGRAIHSLRRQGWQIENRLRLVDGVRHGEFRLGSPALPSSKELRQAKAEAGVTLFPDQKGAHVDDG